MGNVLQNLKPDEIEQYVKEIMDKMMPSNMRGMMNPQDLLSNFQTPFGTQQTTANPLPLNSTTFETHDFVFVRIPIKNDNWVKKIRIYHTSNQLIAEGIPESEDAHTITLPAIVKKKGAVATYKEGILEIRIPKNIDMQYSQVDVSEI